MTARFGEVRREDGFGVGQGLGWPYFVTLELLVDHGLAYYHREQIGHLDPTWLQWSCEQRSAGDLVQATHHPDKTKPDRLADDPFPELERKKSGGFDFWPENTWATPPLFVDGHLLLPPEPGIRLLEGHTRLGVLKGLVNCGDVSADSLHWCWVARRTNLEPADGGPSVASSA